MTAQPPLSLTISFYVAATIFGLQALAVLLLPTVPVPLSALADATLGLANRASGEAAEAPAPSSDFEGIATLLFVIGALAFLRWTFRAARNMHALEIPTMKMRPGTCVLSYIVPIVSLWMPWQGMAQIYTSSYLAAGKHPPTRLPVHLWWLTLLTSGITGALLENGSLDIVPVFVLSFALSTFLVILVMHRITRLQHELISPQVSL